MMRRKYYLRDVFLIIINLLLVAQYSDRYLKSITQRVLPEFSDDPVFYNYDSETNLYLFNNQYIPRDMNQIENLLNKHNE